ncbi:MAG: ABC transporter permease, partial [Candidatus Eremiobacterota bacterium]
MLNRILAIILKEFIQMRRDRLTLATMLGIPLIQLTLFGYAINTDVKHIPMAVVDYSQTESSRSLVDSFTRSHYFDVKRYARDSDEVTRLIDEGVVKVGLIIDPEYETDLSRRKPARVQVLVDASDPQVATSTLANSQGIGNARSMEILLRSQRPGSVYTADNLPVDVEVRAWFNPDLVTANYIVPGLIGIILTMTMMMITSMAIVRERETGTMEQLITTPVRPVELTIGKIIPYILV